LNTLDYIMVVLYPTQCSKTFFRKKLFLPDRILFGEPFIVELIDPEVVDVNADSDDASAVNEHNISAFVRLGVWTVETN
jgi:hypothetical protein